MINILEEDFGVYENVRLNKSFYRKLIMAGALTLLFSDAYISTRELNKQENILIYLQAESITTDRGIINFQLSESKKITERMARW